MRRSSITHTATTPTNGKQPSTKNQSLLLLLLLACCGSPVQVLAQCPWQRDVPDLQTSCICAYNLGRELSVQCDQVDFSQLLEAMNKYARLKPVDLLYVNNASIEELGDNVFSQLSLHNVQLSSCGIRRIASGAFKGQESVLKNLNLQDNQLDEVPVEALQVLSKLNLLDLSRNLLSQIPDDAFAGLSKLSTLKLNDNNVTLASNAFRGLEQSLKNLNLKGTRQRRVPECIRGLKSLAFLDLSQNGIKELPGAAGIRVFDGLDALTALNMERNLIQSIAETAFAGVRKTLSSLSLLNNLLAEFPIGAVHSLKELRVLDIGFNLLTSLPEAAFRGNPSITLLALDGNPLSTVPEGAFTHLNATLRGLSLGGRFLHCDCKLRWVAEWIRNGDLQVTSRERNPQFCGTPPRFRDRGFYSIQPEELNCPEIADAALRGPVGLADNLKPTFPTSPDSVEFETGSGTGTGTGTGTAASSPVATSVSSTPPTTTTTVSTTTTTTAAPTTSSSLSTTANTTPRPATTAATKSIKALPTVGVNGTGSVQATAITSTSSSSSSSASSTLHTAGGKQAPGWRQGPNNANGNQHKPQRPPLVLGYPPQRGTRIDDANEVQVKHAFRQDSSVIIQWDSETANILGFRVVYRLFGEKAFKQGPPLESSEREFKIKNVPAQECIIVCVISLEELHVTPETVPYQQCREVRTVSSQTSNMDKITIAASAAICGTIIVAVIVFIAASRRSRKLQNNQQKSPLPIGGLPVNCCGPTGSPGPLGSIATLSAFNNHKEWDQVSAYSGRSIPRPRIYPVEQPDDMRSHFSGMPGKVAKSRSIADGQSQHSFSNNSHRGYLGSAFPTNLVNSRPELRQSRQSLAAASERMSRASYAGSIHNGMGGGGGGGGGNGGGNVMVGMGGGPGSLMGMSGLVGPGGPASIASSNARRSRPRSRSRDQLNTTHIHNHRPGSRYSQAGSTHTLNNYCDTSDNWTDHDMDIYMARNPTTRNGLVPL